MEYLAHHSAQHTDNMNLPVLAGLAVAILVLVIVLRGKHEG